MNLMNSSASLLILCLTGLTDCSAPEREGVKANESEIHDRCNGVKPMDPRIMTVDLPATAKALLVQSMSEHLAVVRYDGCQFEALPRCAIGGKYRSFLMSRAQDTIRLKTAADAHLKLPLAIASFGAEFKSHRELALDYVVAGTRVADIDAATLGDLRGGCAGATHVVRGITFGAYRLTSVDRTGAALAGDVTVIGASSSAGAGGGGGAEAELLRRDGDVQLCADGSTPAEDPRCQAIVQVELLHVGQTMQPTLARMEDDGATVKAAIGLAIAERNKGIEQCYREALAKDAKLAGRASVHFTVGTAGSIDKVAVEGLDGVFSQCVQDRFLSIRGLPILTKPSVFTQSYLFSHDG